MASSPENLRRAAVLLRCLPSPQRRELLARLDPPQAAAVAAEMNQLGDVGAAEQEAVVRAFADSGVPRCDKDRTTDAVPFGFLHDLPSDALLAAVADEHPQTIAMLLLHLPPQQAAAVLAELTPEQQLSIVCRIATIGDTSPEIIADVENALKRRLAGSGGGSAGNRGVASAIRILNAMDPAAERRLLERLAQADPQLVHEIRRTMLGVDVAACRQWDAAEAAC